MDRRSFERAAIRRVPCRRKTRCLRGGMCFDGLLGRTGERREGGRFVDGEVGQGLAIELAPGELEPVHKLAVAQAVVARRGADTDDPERAKIALLELAAGIG